MDIIGYENYLIYNDGRVYNKKHNKFLKQATDNCGYKHLTLCKEGKGKTHRVHRLVAEHYIPNPQNKKCVDHINRIKTDNILENLRWATHSENGQNTIKQNNNTSGHKNICYDRHIGWVFKKIIRGKRTTKSFKSKIDCICYKFIFMLKIKAMLS
tara:strand:- start:112 stop:576 length:465 start_codon:yes stop_codon:yes gene_type:complete